MIPQSEPEHKDLVDVLVQSVQRIEQIPQEDGTFEKSLVIDPKSLYYKTLIVASPNLARFVLELENFQNLATQVYNFMSRRKATALSEQIKELVIAYQYSIDSKSSESIRENGSAQSTLIDKIARNKIERSYQVKGEKSRSFLDAMMGRDKEDDMDSD
jgi:hypothetical protein|tara:strand:+ start:1193 stop:1666 length:474 start_codon:yes stop_codon:yes gene_type:complete